MYIVSKEAGVLLNFNNIVELFTKNDGALIAKQEDGKIIILKVYETEQHAKEAILIIAEDMKNKNIIHVPTKEFVKQHIINGNPYNNPHHHINGKKTKGHGGS